MLKNSWLIQRLEKPIKIINPFSFGGGLKNGGFSDQAMQLLKDVFAFDYMGAAEFEWGAVPKALAVLWDAGQLDTGRISVGDTALYYICVKGDAPEVIERIVRLWKKEIRVKESLMQNSVRIKGWLELENPFMFFRDREMFNQTIRRLK